MKVQGGKQVFWNVHFLTYSIHFLTTYHTLLPAQGTEDTEMRNTACP